MNEIKDGLPVEILMVEDNPGDVRLTLEMFKSNKIVNHVHVAQDGLQAMAFLNHEQEFKDAPRPDLVILDLNLPGKDGREVLADIKRNDDLKEIPVIVLTTSSSENDIFQTYGLQADSYLTKPIDPDQFLEIIKSIPRFWITIIKRIP